MSTAPSAVPSYRQPRLQLFIGLGTLAIATVVAVGAWFIPSDAGYAGVGPNFLPWLVAGVLALCGALLCRHALHGGYRQLDEASGAPNGDWRALAWVGAGVLANAALITTIGFVLSCALGFMLAVRGLRCSEGKPAGSVKQTLIDLATGIAISAPVFWLFKQVLAINLPGLSASGWI